MKVGHLFYIKLVLLGWLFLPLLSNAQELPKPPKPPEVEVEPPELAGKILEAIGTGLGMSKKSRKNREGLKIHRHSLHEIEQAYYAKNTSEFSNLSDSIYQPNIDSLKYIVMGWTPHWVKNAHQYYSYELLSDLSYYSYELDTKTGGYKTIHDWNTTQMIDSAKANGCLVYLTVSSFGKKNNNQFLRSKKAQSKSIRTLIQLLKYRKAHGVTLDMNPIASHKSKEFTEYVNALATALRGEGMSLNLVLPPVYEESTFDLPSLIPNVELFIIQGYGYFPTDAAKAGPVSPFLNDDSWRFFALNTTIDTYLEQGIPPNKAILSLPYFGSQWKVKSPEIPSLKSEHVRYIPFRSEESFSNAYQFELDPLTYTMFTSFPAGRKSFSQVWMDNTETLKAKYQLIIDKGLKGVALWSLGYDNGTTEYWELLEELFAEPKPEPKTIEEIKEEEIINTVSLIDSVLKIQQQIQDSTNQKMVAQIETLADQVTNIEEFTDAITENDSLEFKGEELKKEVFGWHPHWAGEKYKSYNFNLLSTLAYFSYELEPETGYYKTIHDWATTPVVDSAQAKGTKVHLTVTNFGEANNRNFLRNKRAQRNFINEIVKQIEKRSADGANLNFENIPRRESERFTNFVIRLSERLQREGLEFSMAIPSEDPDYVYDFSTLVNFVDYFVMMGYNYHKNSKVAGPNAPLKSSAKWGKSSIENSVNTYFSRGIPPVQLIVAYPYYGTETLTKSIKIPAESEMLLKEWTYSDIRKGFRKAPIIDMESSSAYYVIPNPDDDQIRQLWFDNEESFAMKCDWINQKKLRGVGIWALGYDHGNNELWTVLNQKFAKDPNATELLTGDAGESVWFQIKHIVNDISLNKNVISNLLIFMLIILFLGFCFAITNSQVVDVLFNSKLYQAGFIILFLLLIVSVFELKNLISSVEVLFFLGGLLGIIVTFIIRKSIVESQKSRP